MASGHPSFDHTIQEGNMWLKAVGERLHFEGRRHAYAHSGGCRPSRRWRLAGKPTDEHSINESCDNIARELPPQFGMDAKTVARGVFDVIFKELDRGAVAKVIDQLPVPLRSLWPQGARRD